jgi:hypothetical protein
MFAVLCRREAVGRAGQKAFDRSERVKTAAESFERSSGLLRDNFFTEPLLPRTLNREEGAFACEAFQFVIVQSPRRNKAF